MSSPVSSRVVRSSIVVNRCIGLLAMHHIYCPNKRAFIIEHAARLGVSGCYVFGKPGRVLVEADEAAVRAYLRGVRSLHWQKCTEMGVFPVAEVLHDDWLRQRFCFSAADLALVQARRAAHELTGPDLCLPAPYEPSLTSSTDSRRKKGRESPKKTFTHRTGTSIQSEELSDNERTIPQALPPTYVFAPHHRSPTDEAEKELVSRNPHDPFEDVDGKADLRRDWLDQTYHEDSFFELSSQHDLQSTLANRGAKAVYALINRPFSGIRPTNYAKDNRFFE